MLLTISKIYSSLFRIWDSPHTPIPHICFVGINIFQCWSAPTDNSGVRLKKKTFKFHYFLAPHGDFDQNKNIVFV